MTMTNDQADALGHEAIAALRSGDAAAAHGRLLTLITDAPTGYPRPWFLLAQACHQLGDDPGERDALERHLAGDPRHLGGLLMLGDLQARAGDAAAASTCYMAARNVAAARPAEVSPPLVAMLRRAEAFEADQARRNSNRLLAAIADAGIAEGQAGPRVAHALDLLLGKAQLYLQQPSMFYFPGLPQRPFYEREEFPWLAEVEAATAAIRDELIAVLDQGGEGFNPYVEAVSGRPSPANPLLADPSWSAFYLWRSGAAVAGNADRCPAAMAALAAAPMPAIAGRSPIALFSQLRPHTRIQPHHGMLNTRLICHLPLIVPDGCGLRVGAETREWRVGETLIFDDSFEHEAWNDSDEVRVVLLFEIWRPELTIAERNALTRIFESIEAYQDQG